MLKKAAYTIGTLTIGGLAYQNITQSYIFTRNLRTIRCGLHILYGYKIAFNQQNYLQIHQDIAKDIYQMYVLACIQNDGLYVKFGQGIAAMDHLLPPPFFKHMSKLQDKAKASSYQKIAALFKQQIGKQIDQVFKQFQKEPIASASIAQVHRAYLKDGTKVAVKIQKPRIKNQFKSDMFMHYMINWVLQTAFELPLLQFVEDIQKNLQKELDFRIQAENAKLGSKKFKQTNRSDIHVPQIIDQYTRKRVMVSQWIEGFKITDTEKLKQFGFNKKSLLEDLIRGFAQQIFVTGFVHCDPHPGNVFVRPDPKNSKKPQLVILDFGLCLQIGDKFRAQYAEFWKAMFLQDVQKMEQICQGWGMKHVDHFAGMQLMRPYSKQKMVNQKVQKKDVIRSQLKLKEQLKQMMKNTQDFPKQLLFIGRNMNLVRSLNKFYGGQADRIAIMAKSAYIGSQIKHASDLQKSYKYSPTSISFTLRLAILRITNWILHLIYNKNVDIIADQKMAEQSKANFQKYGFKMQDQTAYNA